MATALVRRWPWLALAVLGVTALAFLIPRYFPRTAATDGANGAPRPLTLVASGDTAGWIVPCGCTSNQSGGLLRRGTYVRMLRQDHDVAYVDVGGAPGGTSAYDRVKFEAILKGEKVLGLQAHNLGGSELKLGPEYLREVAARLEIPFVSANVRDRQGQPLAEAVRIVSRGGQRVAFAGVVARKYATEALQLLDPRDSLLQTVAAIRGQYDVLIILAYLPEDELQQLAAALPEADVVVGGPTGQSVAPRLVGPTTVAASTNKGKFLVELQQGMEDGRRTWSGSVIELNEKFSDDSDQEANVRAYLAELARHDFQATDTSFASSTPTSAPKGYAVAGNAACLQCHKNDCGHWDGTKHAKAWETLHVRGYHVDSYCQQCHTTNFGLPGGFQSVTRSERRRDVGCESCHGPSLAHVETPRTKTAFNAKDQCIRCHDRENSPKFVYDEYWSRIKHGEKVKSLAPGRGVGTREEQR